MTGLHRLQEEDPSLVVERVDETHQTILRGTGETHLAVAGERLHRKFGVEVADRGRPRPLPRDHHRSRPRPRASTRSRPAATGSSAWPPSASSPSSGARASTSSTRSWAGPSPSSTSPPSRRASSRPWPRAACYGYPVVDVQVTCYDGKYHPVDSSEMSFKMAGSLAFQEAMAKAGPVLLEPISPARGHRARRHAGRRPRRPQLPGAAGCRAPTAVDGGLQVITALVPTAEIQRYAVDLRSLDRRPRALPRRARPLRRHARPTSPTGWSRRRATSTGHEHRPRAPTTSPPGTRPLTPE